MGLPNISHLHMECSRDVSHTNSECSTVLRNFRIADHPKGCVLTHEYIISVTSEGVYAWDISLFDMVRVDADALARRPLVAPHWELHDYWPFRSCRLHFFTTLPLLRDIERNTVLFELLCYYPRPGPQRIVRYQLTVTGNSNEVHGVLKVVGAGSFNIA